MVEGEREILTINPYERGWALVGEIDASNTAALRASFDDLPHTDEDIIELDMSGVTFIDSSGLRVLVELAQRAQSSQISVALIETPPNVARLIDLAELHHLLDVKSSSQT